MDRFAVLPEGCIADILSRTSPREACSASVISRGFKSAAESDNVWEKFLPSEYVEIISRSVAPVVFSTKRQLYFRLSDFPILIDGGKMSFSLDKGSGKKCFMLGARELSIAWGNTPYYWKWTSHPDSRFLEVAELLSVFWLDIFGKLGTHMLSPRTTYAAYLVFKLAHRNRGLDNAKALIRFVDARGDIPSDQTSTVYFKSQTTGREPQNIKLAQMRKDGWMEIETGEFFNDQGDGGEVEAQLMEITRLHKKNGLIVEGIEFRPKKDA